MAVDWNSVPAPDELGAQIYELLARLFPICRSISGDGVRQTFQIVGETVRLDVTEVPTGTQVFDWTTPREWNIREAWIDGPDGRVVDLRDSPLHVLNYSVPLRARMSLDELRPHLFTHATQPDWIPYRTSYYNENWGFCLAQRTVDAMPDGEYEVCIDSTLADGSITYAEAMLPGDDQSEVLLSTYSCHPSLANDNVSGIALLGVLGQCLDRMQLRRSYRLLFSPGTIGPLTWLARNEERLPVIGAGLVVSCAGDPGGMTYKRSRRGDAEVDRAVENVLRSSGKEHRVRDFAPLGGDERQFCSPGIDLPVGAISRTPADEFPEYHSSADDLDFVSADCLGDTCTMILRVVDVLERNRTYRNTSPKGEPQLGRRGLYRSIGGGSFAEAALLWVLNFSDGSHDLLAISDRSGIAFEEIAAAARTLEEHGLLAPA
jgi:aminopeptidase-like protein